MNKGGEWSMEKKKLVQEWSRARLNERLTSRLDEKVSLVQESIIHLRDRKTKIYLLELETKGRMIPVILKIFPFKHLDLSLVERKIYQHNQLLTYFLPRVYFFEAINKEQMWLIMEYIKTESYTSCSVKTILSYLPTIAKLHALTFGEKFRQYKAHFTSWLPSYYSTALRAKRELKVENTKYLLEQALKDPSLAKLIKPSQGILHRGLDRGPNFFPELVHAGQSLIHGDLHVKNIGCRKVSPTEKTIHFIDWESAKYAPVWFDLATLIELYLDNRPDLQKEADRIRLQCVQVYEQEMEKYAISFSNEPLVLLKMAYLQRILERKLRKELKLALAGQRSVKLKIYLDKLNDWGEELF